MASQNMQWQDLSANLRDEMKKYGIKGNFCFSRRRIHRILGFKWCESRTHHDGRRYCRNDLYCCKSFAPGMC